jgi:4-hydroxy-tetrahydrodipicolinate synthase
MDTKFKFSGAIPANLLPFDDDFSIDEPNYRRHLSWLAGTAGVQAIVCNGHAGEVSSLNQQERRRALRLALDEVGDRVAVITGIFTDNTLEAVEMAREAKADGASGLLVFPPTLFMWGAQLRPEMPLTHFQRISDATDLPIIVFEYPPASGIGYQPDTLAALARIENVVAVKDWSNDMVTYERNLRALRRTGRPVALLSSYTMSLFASYVLGADGSISGMGSVTADLHVQLYSAVRRGDLETARRLNDRLDPLVRVFYAPPFVDMHNRMKEALALLGRIDKAVVRPPLKRIGETERKQIRQALVKSGLMTKNRVE